MEAAGFIEAMPIPCLLIDRTERIYAANAEALTLLGQGLIGRNYIAMLRQPGLLDAIEVCLKDRRPRKTNYLSNDGVQDTNFRVSCRFIDGAGERQAGAVLVAFEDITHLEQAGQMRRDFVANVSHELRTPLTALMGFIETLRGPAREDAKARDRFLDIMEGEASRMNRLVGDLLSLSRVEGEERVRPTEEVYLKDVLTSTLHSLRPVADEAGVTLEPNFGEVPIKVTADLDQLIQVFTNLVENAIKYGGSGGRVTLQISYVQRDPALRGPSARVKVIDYGPGIDPVHLPRLTERFYRADSHRSRELGGTGLGLAIVKHIINRHRGRLRVESELGTGSVFTVILPCHEP
ncbi:two-component sensor histidine kinase [Aliishimia ponticola]|uniref:histidine kinase n=1 Tax=Aliishimia ponticola TaxID=2499833 RepID=A0A4S4NII0_9RHOB|nr:ATP-binding protein [Aliishimia ponticola]THH38527.1 two-component sensor histidine kinase [Aliishimia ponticola]